MPVRITPGHRRSQRVGLTLAQRNAVDLLVAGKTDSEVAALVVHNQGDKATTVSSAEQGDHGWESPDAKRLARPITDELVDAFVVRMTIVPAVMSLLDRAAWWLARWLDRILPRVDVVVAEDGGDGEE